MIREITCYNKPVKMWCQTVDETAEVQISNLANHPKLFNHVAIMPDAHGGMGMPIGGVIALNNAVIPGAVGVDIGCGMMVHQLSYKVEMLPDLLSRKKDVYRKIFENANIPVGEGNSRVIPIEWTGFEKYMDSLNGKMPGWYNERTWNLAHKNLGTLGGGNHYLSLEKGNDGYVWLMLHSGSRNLGYAIASYYHELAKELCYKWGSPIPDKDLAFLPADTKEGQDYIRDMNFALEYAWANRLFMMERLQQSVLDLFKYGSETANYHIHHNFAKLERHFGKDVWVHRKGATPAYKDQIGIIPGSMGTSSYVVKGLGNRDSFMSCSHGAGRRMSRTEACLQLKEEDCIKAMEGIYFDGFGTVGRGRAKGQVDLSEAPGAYKDIEEVINNQRDLVEPWIKLSPLAVKKG